MLYMTTGAPGSGKSLSAVEMIVKTRLEKPERVVYTNIKGMNYPGVICVDHEWCLDWYEHCVNDCLIVIDEAQKYWRSSRGGDVPKAVTDLEMHRHDGIDIVMLTQHPTLIHANIRKLVTRHTHLVEYTKESALRWEWREAHDDVQENALRASGEFTEFKYPAELYPYYKSAEVHTKTTKTPKGRIKRRIALITLGVCISMFVIAGIYYIPGLLRKAKGISDPHRVSQTMSNTGAVPMPGQSSVPGQSSAPLTTAQYVAQFIPRVPAQPYSAPAYDGEAVTQHPRIFCAVQHDPFKCMCITDQGTRYTLPAQTCTDIAENGAPYDPYKPVVREDKAVQQARLDQPPSQVSSAPVVVDAGEVGGWHANPLAQPYTPPEQMARPAD